MYDIVFSISVKVFPSKDPYISICSGKWIQLSLASKKESAIYDQMSVLPLSIILVVAPPPAQIIGLGSFVISGPLFISGSYKLIRYRKRKLQKTLTEYRKHQTLPTWVRKKTDKLLKEYVSQQIGY